MFSALRKYFSQTSTRPALADILQEGMLSWLQQSTPNFSQYTSVYHTLILRQNNIGWKQIFLGRFALEWSLLHDDHLTTIEGPKTKFSGMTWVTGVIGIIWKHVRRNWEERNAAKHGSDSISKELALYQLAQREITAVYGLKNQVLTWDKQLFYSTLQTHWDTEPNVGGLVHGNLSSSAASEKQPKMDLLTTP